MPGPPPRGGSLRPLSGAVPFISEPHCSGSSPLPICATPPHPHPGPFPLPPGPCPPLPGPLSPPPPTLPHTHTKTLSPPVPFPASCSIPVFVDRHLRGQLAWPHPANLALQPLPSWQCRREGAPGAGVGMWAQCCSGKQLGGGWFSKSPGTQWGLLWSPSSSCCPDLCPHNCISQVHGWGGETVRPLALSCWARMVWRQVRAGGPFLCSCGGGKRLCESWGWGGVTLLLSGSQRRDEGVSAVRTPTRLHGRGL